MPTAQPHVSPMYLRTPLGSVKEMLGAILKVQPDANDDLEAAQAALCALFRRENLPAQRVRFFHPETAPALCFYHAPRRGVFSSIFVNFCRRKNLKFCRRCCSSFCRRYLLESAVDEFGKVLSTIFFIEFCRRYRFVDMAIIDQYRDAGLVSFHGCRCTKYCHVSTPPSVLFCRYRLRLRLFVVTLPSVS